MNEEEKEWEKFGYKTTGSCEVCGKSGDCKQIFEQGFNYIVCFECRKTTPAELERLGVL